MKFWTVQKRNVMEIIKEKGEYQPDFSKSDYLKLVPQMKDLYELILEAFNVINSENVPGLIFAFTVSDNEKVYEIENIETFYAIIQEKQAAIESLWKELCTQDVVIVELDYEEGFNPILVDINDFQFLIPPIVFPHPYTKSDFLRISKDIYNGKLKQSIFPSGIIQVHLPYIRRENIINIHNMFELV